MTRLPHENPLSNGKGDVPDPLPLCAVRACDSQDPTCYTVHPASSILSNTSVFRSDRRLGALAHKTAVCHDSAS